MIQVATTTEGDWYGTNELRDYPLERPGVPQWLIADMSVTVTDSVSDVFVSSVYVSDTLVSVGVSGKSGGAVVGLMTATVTRDELVPHRIYPMSSVSDGCAGAIVFGEIPVDATADGAVRVRANINVSERAVTRIAGRYVKGINDDVSNSVVTGIVNLCGNSAFRTSMDPDDHNVVRIALTDAYASATTSSCNAAPSLDNCGRVPIRSINGVKPRAGKITLVF